MTDHERLDELMQARRFELGIRTWRALSEKAGISYETLRAIRAGGNPGDATADGLERALRWKPGSIRAILAGGDPEVAARPDGERSPVELLRELQARIDRIVVDPERADMLDKFTRSIDPGDHGSQTG